VTVNSPKEDKGGGKPICGISFSIFFEEIWDYCLLFMDWKTSSLNNKYDYDNKQINPQARVYMDSP
jgi:hypothetical protein